jgi:hypothetical protein
MGLFAAWHLFFLNPLQPPQWHRPDIITQTTNRRGKSAKINCDRASTLIGYDSQNG